jgi:uncharacterized protein (DUF1501 family)
MKPPPSLRRREILKAALAAGGLGALPAPGLMRFARAATGGRTLISIQLNGGNDTLNTVIPYADPIYHSIRGSLAIPAGNVLKLTTQLGLHPSLGALHALWSQGKLAIIPGVGYPAFNYSHFKATQIYASADPTLATTTGWFGRSLDLLKSYQTLDALAGLTIGNSASTLLNAAKVYSPLVPASAGSFTLPAMSAGQAAALAVMLNQPYSGSNLLFDAVLGNGRAALETVAMVQAAAALPTSVTYPTSAFGNSLHTTAQLLRQDTEVALVALQQGTYDTHNNQLGQHAAQLQDLSAGIAAFWADLAAHGLQDRVVMFIWSEFGRRITPNASAGTDHGSAHAALVIGNRVRGGLYGAAPSLASGDIVDGGNLRMQTDFRSVYASLLSSWLGLDDRAILGDAWPTIGFIA